MLIVLSTQRCLEDRLSQSSRCVLFLLTSLWILHSSGLAEITPECSGARLVLQQARLLCPTAATLPTRRGVTTHTADTLLLSASLPETKIVYEPEK